MYEHSYHMDYGTATAKYVDAFMRNVSWEEVDRRFSAGRQRPVLSPAAAHGPPT
jgi:Fe-Mn family superoxide dismutase